jgi:D-3-phosphoglycerate dehydrogenase
MSDRLIWVPARVSAGIHEVLSRFGHVIGIMAPDDATLSMVNTMAFRSDIQLDRALLQRLPRLQLAIRIGSGIDNVDLVALAEQRIQLVRLGGTASSRSVAELGLGMLIMLLRGAAAAGGAMREGQWRKNAELGRELTGLSIAIWGGGPVGRACASLLDAVCADVLVGDHPSWTGTRFRQLKEHDLLRTPEAHVLALPLRPTTRHFLDADHISRLRHRAVVVNVGRWDLIDFSSATDALISGRLGGLGVDPIEAAHVNAVREALCRGAVNLLATPHLGAQTHEAHARLALQLEATLVNHFGLHLTAERRRPVPSVRGAQER